MAWTLVTGGSKRVGAEICRKLAEEKRNILVHYLQSAKEASQIVLECRSFGVSAESIRGDFSSVASTEAFILEIKHLYPDIDALILNVGNYISGSAVEVPVQKWQELFQTNFFAPIALIQGLLPSIRKNKGSIISLGTSGVASMKADTKHTAYTSSKAALHWITKSLARELAPDQVRVNMVSPGQLDISVDLPQDLSTLPMKRAGTSAEVARAIAFLLRQENSYITGQNIEIAGGLNL